jgi:hypothetical protein
MVDFIQEDGREDDDMVEKRPPNPEEIAQAIMDDISEKFDHLPNDISNLWTEFPHSEKKNVSVISYSGANVGGEFEMNWVVK